MNKKNLVLIVFLLLNLTFPTRSKAEDILQITPFSTSSGITENDWDENLTFMVQMNNTMAYTAIQFDLWLPDGMTLIDDEPLELLPGRFPGIVKKGVFFPEHNVSVTSLQDKGHYRIVIYHDTFAPIEGNSGNLMQFYYLTSSEMHPGYYPIKITDAKLAVDAHTGYNIASSTSYVKIDEPGEDASLAMEGYIPSFVNESLASETQLRKLDFQHVTGMGGTFTLLDGRDFNAPSEEVIIPSVIYERDCPSNMWGTICLPFAVRSNANIQYYKLEEVSEDRMLFEPIIEVETGNPVVFKLIGTDKVSVSADNVTFCKEPRNTFFENIGWNMRGSFATITLDPNDEKNQSKDLYYISNDKFWYNNASVPLYAFRGWFETAKSTSSRLFTIGEVGDTTYINVLEHDNGTAELCFDLNGRYLSKPQKGLNIINQRKVIIQ